MLIKDAIRQRMIELDISSCAGAFILGESGPPIFTTDDPRMHEELRGRDFILLGSITNAAQADLDHLVKIPSHTCYPGCEELEQD